MARLKRGARRAGRALTDLEQVRADPEALDALIDSDAASDDIGPTIRHMAGEWFLTDVFLSCHSAGYPTIGVLSEMGALDLNQQVTEAPVAEGGAMARAARGPVEQRRWFPLAQAVSGCMRCVLPLALLRTDGARCRRPPQP